MAAVIGADDETGSQGYQTWGSLTILDELGRGAFGRVCRAWDPALAREVALKLVPVNAADAAVAGTVLREGRLLARLHHPNIVTVFGAQQQGEEVGIWMEYVRGATLADLVKDRGPLGAGEATVMGTTLCGAVTAVHNAGLVHRDIKARNVMREDGGRLVLMDFGAGREKTAQGLAGAPDIEGTPPYMAPEVLQGRPATPVSDLYSLGVLLFYLVTGQLPVKGRSFEEVRLALRDGRRLLLGDVRPNLPDRFVLIVERAMALEPQERYQTAAALRQDLADAAPTYEGINAVPAPDPPAPGVDPGTGTSAGASAGPAALTPTQTLAVAAGVLMFAAVGIWVGGFLSSVAFDLAYGRVGHFASEPPGVWLRVGSRAMVAPLVAALLGSLLLLLVVVLARGLARLSSRTEAAVLWLRRNAGGAAARVGLDDPVSSAAAICVAGAVALAWVLWRFADLLLVIVRTISQAPAEHLHLLAQPPITEFGERALYRFCLEVVIFGIAAAWALLLHRTRRRADVPLAARLAPASVIALALLMLVVPYRALYPDDFQRVLLGDAVCYAIDERPANVLLLCPHVAPPRNRVVSLNDARLRPTGVWENPFSQLAPRP